MILIDGVSFADIGIAEIKRGEKREYKYQLTAENGRRRSELRARYRTYQVELGSVNQSRYDALRAALATNRETVFITLPDGQTMVTLEAEVELEEDFLTLIEANGEYIWDGLGLSVVGVEPLEDGA